MPFVTSMTNIIRLMICAPPIIVFKSDAWPGQSTKVIWKQKDVGSSSKNTDMIYKLHVCYYMGSDSSIRIQTQVYNDQKIEKLKLNWIFIWKNAIYVYVSTKAFQDPGEASSPLERTFHLGVRNTAFSSLENFCLKLMDPNPDPFIQFYPGFNPNTDPQHCGGAVMIVLLSSSGKHSIGIYT